MAQRIGPFEKRISGTEISSENVRKIRKLFNFRIVNHAFTRKVPGDSLRKMKWSRIEIRC